VLVADDFADLRSMVRLCLEGRGWDVREAVDGTAALDACREQPPDLILLDVNMPRLDGWSTLAKLQADSELRHVPVIMLTTADGPQNVAHGLRRGAHDFVAKPFAPLELCARAEAALRVKRLQDELRRRNRELDQVSRTDPVTGLGNRRGVKARLSELASASRRHGQPLAILMIDIDHFKQVNDLFGHTAGDAVLHEVARRLRSSLRREDVAGRWGGDELIAVLPFTDLTAAHAVAERMRVAVGSQSIPVDDRPPLSVTVSIGCAAGIADPSVLLEAADEALYQAKRAGRNAVRS
jgi:two-component system cell cycle response regulator